MLGMKSNPKRPKSNPEPVKSNPEPSNLDPLGFESTDNNNSNKDKTIDKDKKDSFGVLTPTLSNFSLLTDFALTEEDLAPENEEDITDAPTVRMPAIKKLTSTSPAQETPPAHVEAVSEQDAPGQDETPSQLSPKVGELPTSYPPPEQHTLMVVPPRQSARLQKKAARGKPDKEVKPEPTPEESALQERCKTWYERVTEHCGGPMTKAGQVINEHKSIKLACQKFSDTQLELIFVYLTTRDWKWSKIDNKYTVRCYILWDESGRVAQILKEESETKKPPSRSASPTSKPENPYSISALRTRQAKQRQMQGVTL